MIEDISLQHAVDALAIIAVWLRFQASTFPH